MIASLALRAVWSMGTGVVHPEARTGSAGDGRPVGRAEPAGLPEPEAPAPCGGVLACGPGACCHSSVSAPAVPTTASTATASVRASVRPRRRPGRAGMGELPRSPYGGRLASTSAWASRHGSGRPPAARTGSDSAGPRAGLNDISGRSIGRVLVTPRAEPTGSDRSIGRAPGASAPLPSLPAASDASPTDGAAIAGSSGTGASGTGLPGTDPAGTGSRGPGSTRPGDPGPAGSPTSTGPGPTGSGSGGGPGPARSARSLRMKSVKEPLL